MSTATSSGGHTIAVSHRHLASHTPRWPSSNDAKDTSRMTAAVRAAVRDLRSGP